MQGASPCNYYRAADHWIQMCLERLSHICNLEADRGMMLQLKKLTQTHIIKSEEKSWKHDKDPKNQNIDADLAKDGATFEAAIAELDIKSDDSGCYLDAGVSRHISS